MSTDIGLGNAMAAPGVYTDEEGSIFLNDRYPDTSLRHSFP